MLVIVIKKRLFSTLFIDIRGEVIRIVQGKALDNNLNVYIDAFGAVEMPGSNGLSIDQKTMAENAAVLKKFLHANKMNASRVVAGLGINGIITRNIRVPKLSPNDLASMMNMEINDYLPVSWDEYTFDYKVMDEVEEDDRSYLDLIVAAVNTKQARTSGIVA